ncbi:aminotransferase class V-fold PLP-dependent enzyme [Pseudomonas sp. GX19020]|uniref:aminotransferase class V-fold PLP-dependent enzyme n=1 Tax=Pseudomonas sp. GX19020 TaxID=2942277 RepID=UPI0020189E82|nr:aminotransferase class V-fold PLP-dependent enzyme [Pseudomonas sp. GX19020]MCL4068698.1 aminotransferase class V-fold PLP-dependent enzyme [Pseudomonas sp. GX19020]
MQGIRGLFVPGPTNVPEAIRKAIDVPMEDHRSPDVPALVLPLFQDLKKVFHTETGQVFIFPATGTGGWEASITNTLSPGDKVLAPRFGQFSVLWVDLCQRLGLDVETIDCEWGTGVPLDKLAERLSADKKREIKAILACHNETATGVTSDIAGVRKVMDQCDHPALLYVDGISSIGSLEFRMDEWGVDLAVAGSQKGFMMPAGLAIIGVSQKALEASKANGLRRCYFDFKDMTATNATGYFPYTPPMNMLRGLRASLDRINAEGIENIWARHKFLAEGVRRAVSAWNMTLCAKEPKWHSDTVSAIVVPEGHDARQVIARAYDRYGLSLGAGLSVVAGKVFRIGHLGDLNELMLMMALGGAEMSMRDVGIPIEAGSGVAAAEEFWRKSNSRSMALAAE